MGKWIFSLMHVTYQIIEHKEGVKLQLSGALLMFLIFKNTATPKWKKTEGPEKGRKVHRHRNLLNMNKMEHDLNIKLKTNTKLLTNWTPPKTEVNSGGSEG